MVTRVLTLVLSAGIVSPNDVDIQSVLDSLEGLEETKAGKGDSTEPGRVESGNQGVVESGNQGDEDSDSLGKPSVDSNEVRWQRLHSWPFFFHGVTGP